MRTHRKRKSRTKSARAIAEPMDMADGASAEGAADAFVVGPSDAVGVGGRWA